MATSASIIPSASIPTMHQRQDSKCAQLDLWSRITGDALLSTSPPSSSCLLQERHNSPRHHPPTHRRNATAPYFNNNYSPKHSEFIIEHDNEPLLDKVEVPRYAEAQYSRTLHHPNMKQPSMDQEERHLAMLFSQRNRLTNEEDNVSLLNNTIAQDHDTQSVGMVESAHHQQELVEKLSKALMLGSTNSNHELAEPKGHDHFPSPTSTLFFPDSSFDNNNNNSPNDEYAEDSFIGTCGLVSSELEKLKYSQNYSIGSHNYECVEVEGHDSSTAGNATLNNFGELEPQTLSHSFVICSDTQLGISSKNMEWETELEYSRQAVRLINAMSPPPRFVCVCGDLIDMEYTFEENKGYSSGFKSKEECDKVQDQQNEDFKRVWKEVHPDVALVCLCGNHDVGNRPTPESIQRYKDSFGDEYLSFWTNGTYNIVINNVLFVDPSGAQDMFDKQLVWLEDRLKYAHEHNAKMVFVFGHHPFFLYDENESPEVLSGSSPFPSEWQDPSQPNPSAGFPDAYFSIPKKHRMLALDLFKKYGVNAVFSGHFHQNVISKSSWGMDHIITAPLSVVFESSGKPKQSEANGRGIRVVDVNLHSMSSGESFHDVECKKFVAGTADSSNWIRNGGTISHRFQPLNS